MRFTRLSLQDSGFSFTLCFVDLSVKLSGFYHRNNPHKNHGQVFATAASRNVDIALAREIALDVRITLTITSFISIILVLLSLYTIPVANVSWSRKRFTVIKHSNQIIQCNASRKSLFQRKKQQQNLPFFYCRWRFKETFAFTLLICSPGIPSQLEWLRVKEMAEGEDLSDRLCCKLTTFSALDRILKWKKKKKKKWRLSRYSITWHIRTKTVSKPVKKSSKREWWPKIMHTLAFKDEWQE